MGDFLSGIGDAFSGVVNDVEGDVGAISKLPDPIATGIDFVGKAVGLDPKITGAIELAASFFTGDLSCAINGANDILNGKSQTTPADSSSQTSPAVNPPTPGYASPAKTNVPTPPAPMDDHTVLQTIRDHFGDIDTNKDGTITSGELAAAATNPKLPPDVQQACKQLFSDDKLASEFGTNGSNFSNRGSLGGKAESRTFTTSQLDEELTRHPASSAPTTSAASVSPLRTSVNAASLQKNTGVAPPSAANVNASSETYQQALQTISDNFALFDTAAGVGGKDGLIGRNDLQAILNDPNAPADVKAAAKFMLDNPAYFNEAEVAQNGGKMDGLLGQGDVAAELARLKAAAASGGSTPSTGSAPAASAGSTPSTTPAVASSTNNSSPVTVSGAGGDGTIDGDLAAAEGNAQSQINNLMSQLGNPSLTPQQLAQIQAQLQQV